MAATTSNQKHTKSPIASSDQAPTPSAISSSLPSYTTASFSAVSLPPPSSTVHTQFSSSLPPLAPQHGYRQRLPSLSSVTGDMATTTGSVPHHASGTQLPSIHSLPAYQRSPIPQSPSTVKADSPTRSMDLDSVVSAASPDGMGRSGSVSLDDPDVRLAAEALGDLRADFVSSPPSTIGALSPPIQSMQLVHSQSPQASEPLLSLLTTSHPFLASTIEGASSAYGGAKNFSPRFKSSAEYVEGYLTPIANTVGSVGRVTGVEGGVRWFLGAGRRGNSDSEGGSSKKRRKLDTEGDWSNKRRIEGDGIIQLPPMAAESGHDSFPSTPKGDRRLSMASTVDTLPAYDEMRSPAYTETASRGEGSNPHENAAWQSRLITSTSGLSVAMSDESLRSLKYCLRWLRWANDHIGGVVGSLKHTIEEFDREDGREPLLLEGPEQQEAENAEKGEAGVTGEEGHRAERSNEPSKEELATKINTLKGDVVKTLHDAVNMVSRYAGGALPENASVLVRRHLTSLPARFRIALINDNQNNGGQGRSRADSESAVRDNAQRVLVLAKEGLDMVVQVSGVLDGTIVSAEEWCERMGRRRNDSAYGSQSILPQIEPAPASTDVKMGETQQ